MSPWNISFRAYLGHLPECTILSSCRMLNCVCTTPASRILFFNYYYYCFFFFFKKELLKDCRRSCGNLVGTFSVPLLPKRRRKHLFNHPFTASVSNVPTERKWPDCVWAALVHRLKVPISDVHRFTVYLVNSSWVMSDNYFMRCFLSWCRHFFFQHFALCWFLIQKYLPLSQWKGLSWFQRTSGMFFLMVLKNCAEHFCFSYLLHQNERLPSHSAVPDMGRANLCLCICLFAQLLAACSKSLRAASSCLSLCAPSFNTHPCSLKASQDVPLSCWQAWLRLQMSPQGVKVSHCTCTCTFRAFSMQQDEVIDRKCHESLGLLGEEVSGCEINSRSHL